MNRCQPKQGTWQTTASGVLCWKEGFPLDYTDLLRRLSLHDERVVADVLAVQAPKITWGEIRFSIRERWRW